MSTNLYSGFCQVNDLIINGSTSALGELTVKTSSYAKEPNYYFKDNKNCSLVVFRGISETSKYEKIPSTHSAPIIEMLNWLYEQAVGSKVTNSSQSCLQLLKSTYTTGWNWKAVGTMVTNNDIWLPSSINFTYEVSSVVHEFKIWFANSYFEVEFPYRDIYVVHPVAIESIDNLMTMNYKQIQELLYSETTDKIEERVKELIGDNLYPYSARTTMSFNIYDLVNTPNYNKGVWTIIYYGNPTDGEEEAQEEIKKSILANSQYDETKWSPKIADLFNPLEFTIIPHFDEIGISNETVLGSTYTPVFTFKTGDRLAQKYADFYTSDEIIESLQVVPVLYKSGKMSFVGKPKNNSGKTHFLDVYPDYQLIPSTDSQSGAMSKTTTKMIFDLEELIAAAETVTPDGIPPTGIQRVTKNERLYLTKRTDNVKLTIITRYQFIKDGLLDE